MSARTTESQTHRQMASGLSMPVGFKNATDGSLQVAIDAMLAAQHPHSFLGIDISGRTCIVQSKGSPWGHLILRGGQQGPNCDASSSKSASAALEAHDLCPRFIVDCSHANSEKDHRRQEIVWHNVIAQRVAGNDRILGLMVEGNLEEGSQPPGPGSQLRYGVSITDACSEWQTTREMILRAADALGGDPRSAAQP
jgi:3-deoxy-7-phosphoheptulonate synthase